LCQRIEESPAIQERLTDLLGDFRCVNYGVSSNEEDTNTSPNAMSIGVVVGSDKSGFTASSNGPLQRPVVHVHALRTAGEGCPRFCRCTCHKTRRFQSWQLTKRWTGTLSVAYSGISALGQSCSLRSCKRASTACVRATYVLPAWLASRMVSVLLRSAPLAGPELLLRTYRLVDTNVFYFADTGNLQALRSMFVRGEASTLDVKRRTGYSALQVSS